MKRPTRSRVRACAGLTAAATTAAILAVAGTQSPTHPRSRPPAAAAQQPAATAPAGLVGPGAADPGDPAGGAAGGGRRGRPLAVRPSSSSVRVVHAAYAGTRNPYQRLTATYDTRLRRAPWVVTVHGGSWVAGSEANLQPAVDVLRVAGFQVFNISYRLGVDRPGSPAAGWLDQRRDVLAAIAWVRGHARRFGLDPDRGALLGTSAGGNLAAAAGLAGDGGTGIRAIVSVAGVLEPQRLWLDLRTPFPRERFTRRMAVLAGQAAGVMGCEYETGTSACARRWRAFDPASAVSSHDPAVLMFQGLADGTVPYRMPRHLEQALRAAGVPAQLVYVPGGGHTPRIAFDAGTQQRRLVQFLRQRTAA
ncbi:Acetyl esterase/lipase [Jatrophihabitans endophyticus]|uniref:Acetyl esterase/lipase n=1 Tax=Jatrophihabitans endophyticus TaxID=1206085 RepID=A0A1M5DIB1_9ACTN|nr:alpha/beta hydrolase [Jatrophihabitans endophyticus]SHF66713.1 Acetyl esterase/lipase [Jatrophihabitans endophyticus]